MESKKCKSKHIVKAGYKQLSGRKVQRYHCQECKYYFTNQERYHCWNDTTKELIDKMYVNKERLHEFLGLALGQYSTILKKVKWD